MTSLLPILGACMKQAWYEVRFMTFTVGSLSDSVVVLDYNPK